MHLFQFRTNKYHVSVFEPPKGILTNHTIPFMTVAGTTNFESLLVDEHPYFKQYCVGTMIGPTGVSFVGNDMHFLKKELFAFQNFIKHGEEIQLLVITTWADECGHECLEEDFERTMSFPSLEDIMLTKEA